MERILTLVAHSRFKLLSAILSVLHHEHDVCILADYHVSLLVSVNTSEAPLVAAGVADIQAVKVPHTAAPKTQGLWTPTREPAPLWKTDIDGKMEKQDLFLCLFTKGNRIVSIHPWYN